MGTRRRARRRAARRSRLAEVATEHWFVLLIAHTLATLLVMLAARWLGVPPPTPP